jgi:hypothetical protein
MATLNLNSSSMRMATAIMGGKQTATARPMTTINSVKGGMGIYMI